MDVERQKQALAHLGGMIAIPTVSAAGTEPEMARFNDLHAYLRNSYPLVHSRLECETVKQHSLLYRWKGSSAAAAPFALIAHLDVVPVEVGTENDWAHPPFAGVCDGAYIWGRGASDTKCLVAAILEAAEALLQQGFEPQCDIYFGFGHNEEVITGGPDSGAACIAASLQEKGVHLRFVLDEGGVVISDSFMGIKVPIATIGVAEKGYCDLKITVEGPGGHSAEPPPDTAVTLLAKLLRDIKPGVPRLCGTVAGMLRAMGGLKGGAVGFVMRHPRVFWALLRPVLLNGKQTAAMLRTTVVATMLSAGTQANVLPQSATAVLNARLLPGDTDHALVEGIAARAAKLGMKCTTEVLRYSPPPKETPSTTAAFMRLAALTQKIHGAGALPYMVTGCTDSREYAGVADEIYRFYPFALSFDELDGMHGTNERLKCTSYLDGIEFLTEFIRQSAREG